MEQIDDIPLSKLALTTRTYNICKGGGLTSLSKIAEYYRVKRTFHGLMRCGLKAEEELLGLLSQFGFQSVNNTDKDEPPDYMNNGFPGFEMPEKPVILPDPESPAYNLLNAFFIFYINHLSCTARKLIARSFNTSALLYDFVYNKSLINVAKIPPRKLVEISHFQFDYTHIDLISLIQSLQDLKSEKIPEELFIKLVNKAFGKDFHLNFNEFFAQYYDPSQPKTYQTYDETITGLMAGLNGWKKNVLVKFIEEEIQAGSPLVIAVLISISDCQVPAQPEVIYKFLVDLPYQFNDLFEDTRKELNILRKRIEKLVVGLSRIKEVNQNGIEYVSLITKLYFNHIPDKDFQAVFCDTECLPVFRLIKFLLESHRIYISRNPGVFNESFTLNNSCTLFSLRDKGQGLKLPQEKTGHMRAKTTEYRLDRRLRFLRLFDTGNSDRYKNIISGDIIYIDDAFAGKLNKLDNVEISHVFYFHFLKLLFENTYSGLISTDGKKMFLISKDASDVFDFDMFMKYISKKMAKPEAGNNYITSESLMTEFFKTEDRLLTVRITHICEKLLFYGFDIISQPDAKRFEEVFEK